MYSINDIDSKYIDSYLKEILNNKNFLLIKNFTHHGKVSTYDHCIHVAAMSLKINNFFNLNSRIDVLLKASVLHDFILYDWHNNNSKKLHGFTHAKEAATNAKMNFNVNQDILQIIESHMWPLNITKIPKSKEAIIVCIADKYCALLETLFLR